MKLFISKSIEDCGALITEAEKNGVTVVGQSLIETKSVPFTPPAHYDFIFFGSKRAVDHFLDRSNVLENASIACAGKATAEHLASLGYDVCFYPEMSGDPVAARKEFMSILGSKIIYFPSTRTSQGSYHEEIPPKQKIVQDTYETILKDDMVEACDWYVFTSPSNFQAFSIHNQLPQNAEVIAWGTTTERILTSSGVTVNYCLDKSSISSLISLLKAAAVFA